MKDGEGLTSAQLCPVDQQAAHARRFRDHLGTDSVRSKLPPCVPVSPSPVSREASRDLWRSIDSSAIVALNCDLRCERAHGVRKYNDGLIFIFNSSKPYLSDDGDETATTVVMSSDGGRPQSFTQAAPNELKLGKEG